VSIRTTLNH